MIKKELHKLTFQTSRFEMRPFARSDFNVWQQAMLQMKKKQNKFDDAVLARKQITRDFFLKMVTRHQRYRVNNVIYYFGVFDRKNGALVGEVLISLIQRLNVQSARISYGVFNNFWRQGIGIEVVNAAVLFAFKKLKLHRLEAEIQPDNKASIALAKAAGFSKEGYRRKAVYFDNDWHDHVVYAINPEDIGFKGSKLTIKM